MSDALLVAIDLEAPGPARDATWLATWLAEATGCGIVAATIFAPHPGPLAPQLDRHRLGLTSLFGRPVETLAIAGTSPTRLLHELCDERRPLAIVVGPTRGGQRGVVTLGSVGELLLHGVGAPVLVAPADYRAPAGAPTIGVAFGGTPEAHEAVRVAAGLAERMRGRLRVLTVAEPPGHDALAGYSVAPDQLERAPAGVTAERVELTGEPATALAAASADLDLLIAGSRSYGPLGVVLLGAVTRRLVRAASCPTMIVPRLRDPALAVAMIGGMESVADT